MLHLRIIVGISGASGAIYGVRILQELNNIGVETHLIVSDWACETIREETVFKVDDVKGMASVVYNNRDMGAAISSGSFLTNGMIIAPCSMKTLAAIAHGYADNLISRAADVCLKEKRKLVVMPREMPFNTIHLENMLSLSRMGAVIASPVPSYYNCPQTINDIVNQTVGRVIDQFSLEQNLVKRWKDE